MVDQKQSDQTRQDRNIPFFRSVRTRLVLAAVALLLIPLAIIGLLVGIKMQNALEEQAFDQLVAVRKIKARQIETFFRERTADARILSQDPTTIQAMKELATSFAIMGAQEARALYLNTSTRTDGDSGYSTHAKYHLFFRRFGEAYGYHDLFLVEAQNGNIVYTMAKEDEFGTSLLSGPYAETNFARAFNKAKELEAGETFLVDFEKYARKDETSDETASFIVSPIYSGSQLVGVLMLQSPIERIGAIMTERAGMGNSGETFLVGPDKLMRSDSRFEDESTILNRTVDTSSVRRALAGETGTIITTNYRGVEVLSAYAPLDIEDVNWAIVAEIDKAEAFAPVRTLMMTLASMTAVMLLLVAIIAFLATRQLSKPIMTMTNVAARMAAGDFEQTIEISKADEIGILGRAFNQMMGNLRYLLEQTENTSRQLSASAEELAAMMAQMNVGAEQVAVTVAQMAQGAAAQAQQAEETSHTVARLDTATGQISNNARQTDDASTQAQELMEGSARIVQTLENKLGEIEKITSMVNEIADQTNLLSLNASIEAARAGEHGRGFAVVADEVRRLADHSASSAGDIAALSQEIGKRLGKVRAAIDETREAVEQTVALARETRTATQEQKEASEAMVSAMNEMATVAEENASASEEIAASVEEQVVSMGEIASYAQTLSELSAALQKTVSEFTSGSAFICPYFAACPIFESASIDESLAAYINQYCKGDFDECARKRLKESGQPVPPALLPDGSELS